MNKRPSTTAWIAGMWTVYTLCAFFGPAPAPAAERMVLGEDFTNKW